ncbi:uncharacterized protein C3orf38 homolog [Tiliqua scincoides]|uniref:uncharacterized protein C3orf38 homolog n=1 Tax=Tiliqua scincoides TaxID=71010 RepID=UPI003462C785
MASAGAGMTDLERGGCQEVLELLPTEDLMALVDTVTNRLVQPSSRKEAIRAIVLYSQSAEELLKRKKVFRDTIFRYLAKKGIVVPPTSEKHQLISRAKEYWCEQLERIAPEQKYAKPDVKNPKKEEKQGGEEHRKEYDYSKGYCNLGQEFCQWFFALLNSQNPLLGKPHDDWGPQHFWDDATLNFSYNTLEKNVERHVGAELVSHRLLSLVKDEYLYLNPNLNIGGLRCTISRHGLVIVAVAGTVHRNTSCLGVFEQIFGLIRCPFRENTWKIKFVTLSVVGQNALESGTQIERPCIKYKQEELQDFYASEELAVVKPQTF